MKICFDFRAWQDSSTRGIGRYCKNLFEELVRRHDIIAYALVGKNDIQPEFSHDVAQKFHIINYEDLESLYIPSLDFYFIGNVFSCSLLENIETITDSIYPPKIVSHCNNIVAINHDFIPMVFAKDWFGNAIDTEKHKYVLAFESLREACHLFVNSECTKHDTEKLLRLNKEDISCIYGGVDDRFLIFNSDKYCHKKRTNSIVLVGGSCPRKNNLGLVKSFTKALSAKKIPDGAKLYLIGLDNSKTEQLQLKEIIGKIDKSILGSVISTGKISDHEMMNLISTSKASFFPSFYEGLGLPILESYALNTPCFASNLSSTKEFTLQDASFNPYNEEEMEDKIVEAFNNANLCEKSLEFGKNLLKKINWQNAADITFRKLSTIKNTCHTKDKRIAVYSTLPPDYSGIANFTIKTHRELPYKYDVFCDFKSLENLDIAKSLCGNVVNVLPKECACDAVRYSDYVGKIFVLGNSYHNIFALQQALENTHNNAWIYLHDTFIFGLWESFFSKNYDTLKVFYAEHYSKFAKKIYNLDNDHLYQFLHEKNILGVKPLLHKSGIKNILVNNSRAQDSILNDVGTETFKELNVHKVFHPIEDLTHVTHYPFLRTSDEIYIGTFGGIGTVKAPELIIDAVKLLSKKLNIKLVIAGYNVGSYVNSLPTNIQDLIICFDSPSTELLYSLMKGVDLAVQLRVHSHGESSGCINQLLGAGTLVVTTEGFLEQILLETGYITETPKTIDSYMLASVINKNLHTKKKIVQNKLHSAVNTLTYKNLSTEIYNIVSSNNRYGSKEN